jgi:hypothetical protein
MATSKATASFLDQGFAVLPEVADQAQCDALAQQVAALGSDGVGTRRLLDQPWCRAVARSLRASPLVGGLLEHDYVAVQCTYFGKSPEQNWLVALHQDLSIPVKDRIANEVCTGWSEKEGVLFVQPPVAALEELVAVRVHIDESASSNGPLRVVPGSHREGRLAPEQVQAHRLRSGEQECVVSRGGVLAMRPLLLHASSKSRSSAHRRVLHFVFGPPNLPCGLRWRDAV